ncbi:MAG TPA: diadenylate cyclase CdaA, partial [Gemmatimonadaceae bacterium]|nr:diadenylate cyclase CdaA [Gemmatimonadaceae bacterium]
RRLGDPSARDADVSFLDQFRFLDIGWRDAIGIVVVAYVIYRVLLLIHGTRALQMLLGIIVVVLVYALAWLLKLTMITYLLGLVFTYGVFAALVVFQPELRAALAHLGHSRFTRLFRRMEAAEVADEIVDAVERLGRSGIGAILAIEREMGLGDYVASGSAMQAKVSADLLATIFTPYSPLHDGAVLIRGDTIIGAGCILPLSQRPLSDRTLGTRHRAAIGLSEEVDALVIVVSEETSIISVAEQGTLVRNLTAPQLRDVLSGRAPRPTGEHPVLELRA